MSTGILDKFPLRRGRGLAIPVGLIKQTTHKKAHPKPHTRGLVGFLWASYFGMLERLLVRLLNDFDYYGHQTPKGAEGEVCTTTLFLDLNRWDFQVGKCAHLQSYCLHTRPSI